ncbi:MAG: hydroxymethylbilane synthase [Angustibacter sp.]
MGTSAMGTSVAPGRGELLLGTRRSPLALAQSREVAVAFTAATGRAVRLVEVTTDGDVSRAQLSQIGGTGVFAGALRHALRDGRIDLAVHSLKDLPTAPEPGLVVAAIPVREDARDVLVTPVELAEVAPAQLPPGTRIGTGSPRRSALLRRMAPEVRVVPVRGNVGTRIEMMLDGTVDGVLLARAGLLRLSRAGRTHVDQGDVATHLLDLEVMVPAPGQGALAVECRADRPDLIAELAAVLDDPLTRACVAAERAVLAALGSGCAAPVGAHANLVGGDSLQVRAVVAEPRGTLAWYRSIVGPVADAEQHGQRLVELLLAAGALDSMAGSPAGGSPQVRSGVAIGAPEPERPSGPRAPDPSSVQRLPERAP